MSVQSLCSTGEFELLDSLNKTTAKARDRTGRSFCSDAAGDVVAVGQQVPAVRIGTRVTSAPPCGFRPSIRTHCRDLAEVSAGDRGFTKSSSKLSEPSGQFHALMHEGTYLGCGP